MPNPEKAEARHPVLTVTVPINNEVFFDLFNGKKRSKVP